MAAGTGPLGTAEVSVGPDQEGNITASPAPGAALLKQGLDNLSPWS
jgi:hypothetical protein